MEIYVRPVRILLIDDDEEDYLLVRDLLSGLLYARFELHWAADDRIALDAIQSTGYDICLLDYRLGDRNGLDLLEQLKEYGFKAPVVFLTGQGDYELDLEAMRAGAADYLTKDQLSSALLERSIRYAIERKQEKEELLEAKRVIREARDQLERLVEERTAELLEVNAELKKEIEERKQAEEALRESEEHYRFLFDNMLNGFAYCRMIFEHDQPKDFIYLSVNKAFEAQTGLKGASGRRVTEVIPGIRESDPQLFEIYAGVARTGTPEHFETYVEALKMWFSISVYSPKKDYFVAVFDVITERKQAEQALRYSREQLRLITDAAPVLISYIDRGYRYRLVNRTYERWFGLSREKVVGKHVRDVLGDPVWDKVRDYMERALGGEQVAYDAELPYPTAGLRWVHVSYTPDFDESGRVRGFVVLVHDIGEAKKAEKILRYSLEEKVALLKEVHHRVKNNLQIVASLLGLQAHRSKSPQVVDVLEDTRNRVRSMAMLHEALYRSENLARINFAFYVRDLCGQLLQSFGSVAARVEVDYRIERIGLPLELAVPCGLIINELVSNALKHGFPGGRAGRITIEMKPTAGQMLALSVCDNGVGLPSCPAPAQNSTLGLKMVSRLAGQVSGRFKILDLSGTPGAGFSVIFPFPDKISLEGET